MIALIRLYWQRRNTPWHDLMEEYTLLLKAARRCAYDLSHAAGSIRDDRFGVRFSERAQMWINIFSPDGVKDYRHRLHTDIAKLEFRVERLRELCRKNDVDPEVVDNTEF